MEWLRLLHTAHGVPDQKATTHPMNTRRSLVLLAAAVIVAVMPVHAVVASAPPTTVPPTTVPPTTPVEPADGSETQPTEIVESWALAPAGSSEVDGAGNRPELTYVADPGAVIEDAVTLFNFGTVQLTFRIYSTDAFNNDEGQFDLLPGDQDPTDLGSWVTFPQEMVTVSPGQQVTLPITITVPPDAAPGDHAGAVLASSPTLGTGEQGDVVTLDRRTGTRLYLRVNGALTPELAVADVETSYEHSLNPLGGSAKVTYRIENRGNVRLGGTATVSIAGPFGLGEKTVTLPDVPELLPGEDVSLVLDVDDVPALMLDRSTVRVTPTGAEVDGDVEVATGGDLMFAPPIAALLVLLAFIFGLSARRRYVRHRAGAPVTAAPSAEAQDDETLQPQHS